MDNSKKAENKASFDLHNAPLDSEKEIKEKENKESFDQTVDLNSVFVEVMEEQKQNPTQRPKYNFSDPNWANLVRYKGKFYDKDHHTYKTNFLKNLDNDNKLVYLWKKTNEMKLNRGLFSENAMSAAAPPNFRITSFCTHNLLQIEKEKKP